MRARKRMDDREAFLRPSPLSPVPKVDGFSEFYRQFVPSLLAFLMWQGARLPEAADVAQETMIQAYRHWSTIEHPQAWVRRVASRIVARRIATIEVPVEQIGEWTALLPAATNVAAWEQRHEVLRALSHLPPRQRQVMAWTLDGYRPSEIAEELRITPEAVRSNLKKARRALAAYLAESGGTR
jgi:RNA polymerase sigma factor (sigma-70 family)